MKYPLLKQLAINILLRSETSLSKVRFAKVIYFVFKYAVASDNNAPSDLRFARMPLGPVPVGFMELNSDPEFKIEETSTGLMYNRQNYYLTDKSSHVSDNFNFNLDDLITKIEHFSTSELVELSHQDSSWINHRNGEEYFINPDDLKKLLPRKSKPISSSEIDDQLVQARLVVGMEDDAVADSTFIEYPEVNDGK